MLACLPALESWCAIESLTLTNCDRLFYCHPIMRNKTVAGELMSGVFLLFLALPTSATSLSPPLQPLPLRSLHPPPPLPKSPPHPSIFIILPHPNNNTAGTQHKTRGPWPNESHAFTAVKWPVSITSCDTLPLSLSLFLSLAVALSLGGQGLGGGGGVGGAGRQVWVQLDQGRRSVGGVGGGGEKDRKSPCFQLPFSGARFSLPPLGFFARPFWSQLTWKIANTHTHTHTHTHVRPDPPPLHPSHSAIFVWTGLRSSRKALSDVLK